MRYQARHPVGTKARLAFDLLLYTGVRRSDVVRLGPQMERSFAEPTPDGKTVEVQKLLFTETKGRSRRLPRHTNCRSCRRCAQSIDATPTGHLVYLGDGVRENRIQAKDVRQPGSRRRCRLKGVHRASQRAWPAQARRHSGAPKRVETEHQLMALFGWTNPQQAAVYTRKANRVRALKLQAATLLQATKPSNQKCPTFTPQWRPVGQTGPKNS